MSEAAQLIAVLKHIELDLLAIAVILFARLIISK